MPAQYVQTDAIVLTKQPPGDTFQTFSVFSAEHGSLFLLQRIGRSGSTSAPLDLFDEVALLLETSNQGRTHFVKEARILTRHAEIGRSYDALRLACSLAGLIARNPVNEESRGSVASLLRTALVAFGTSPRPDIVYIKSVYRFARDEGYPLKEEWFPTLPASDRAGVAALLNSPLSDQTASPEEVARWQRRLEEYLKGNTEILLESSN